ncbi:MAG: type II secretion system protein GspM [bacterium]
MKLATVINRWMARVLPRQRDRRVLAIGVVVISSMLMLSRGVPAWKAWDESSRVAAVESRRELDVAHAAIERYRSDSRARERLAQQLDSLSGAYLSAPGSAVAGAALATLVSDLAAESGVKVTSASVRPDSATRSPFVRLGVRVSATGDAEGLSDYLSSIESSRQLLAVRELSVAQTDPAAPDSRAEALHFELLVEGLVRIASVRDTISERRRETPLTTAKR